MGLADDPRGLRETAAGDARGDFDPPFSFAIGEALAPGDDPVSVGVDGERDPPARFRLWREHARGALGYTPAVKQQDVDFPAFGRHPGENRLAPRVRGELRFVGAGGSRHGARTAPA